MADDFELPDAEEDIANEDFNFQNEATSAGPQKVGEEKEIVKGGIKKRLQKEGTGWETPEAGDEVKGQFRRNLDVRYSTLCVFILFNVSCSIGGSALHWNFAGRH